MNKEEFRARLESLRQDVAFSEHCYPNHKAQVVCEAYVKSDRLAFAIEMAWLETMDSYRDDGWRALFHEACEFMADTMQKAEDANELVRQIRISKQKKYTIRRNPA